MLRPALDQLIIRDRLALGLLVVKLRPGSMLGAEPFRGIALRIKPRTAAVVDLALLVHRLHAGHDLIHLPGEAIERLLRRERAGIDVADVLPEELGELRIVGHVDAGRRPGDTVGRAVELDQTAELRRAFGERLVEDRALADEGETDLALLHVNRLREDELRPQPGCLAPLERRGLEERPRSGVLIAALGTFLPVRAVRRRGHAPERHALVVDGVVTLALR